MTYPSPIILADESQLTEYLNNLKTANQSPTVAGMGVDGRSFMALLDDEGTEVMWDNPTHTKADWKTPENSCPDCGAVTARFPLGDISYPVAVLTASVADIPEPPAGEPVVDQPPSVEEIQAAVENPAPFPEEVVNDERTPREIEAAAAAEAPKEEESTE